MTVEVVMMEVEVVAVAVAVAAAAAAAAAGAAESALLLYERWSWKINSCYSELSTYTVML
jgi:hypothetical protein